MAIDLKRSNIKYATNAQLKMYLFLTYGEILELTLELQGSISTHYLI